jgi:hypothetical protein
MVCYLSLKYVTMKKTLDGFMSLMPLEAIENILLAGDERMSKDFMSVVRLLYRFDIFKPLLDLCASLAKQKRLTFKMQPRKFYTIDEGNCLTHTSHKDGKIHRQYIITIKQISGDVIIHEISHMLEKESDIQLDGMFMEAAYSDIGTQHSANVALNALVRRVMVLELETYPKLQHPAELFARFFQVMAMSKDVVGHAADSGHKVEDVYKAFPNIIKWFAEIAYPLFMSKIDAEIAQQSRKYIVPLQDIKHHWSDARVKSKHEPGHSLNDSTKNSKAPALKKTKWGSSIKPLHN